MLFGDNKSKTDQIEMEFGTHLSRDSDLYSGTRALLI